MPRSPKLLPMLAALVLNACGSSNALTTTLPPPTPSPAPSPSAATQRLTVTVSGLGKVSGGEIDCPAQRCVTQQEAGSELTLRAAQAAGYQFMGWEGACAGTAPLCVYRFTADAEVRARFVEAMTPTPPPPAPVTRETSIDNVLINESSGLARSQRSKSLLWTHNDSGGNAEGYAIDTNGHYLGTLALIGGSNNGAPEAAQNLDWEDMASVTLDGKPYLVFADIGDNSAFRPALTLYVVEEPDVAGLTPPFHLDVAPAWTINLAYPDGPRDCESLMLDGLDGRFYMVSKRDAQPMLYSASLLPPARVPGLPSTAPVMLQNLGAINIPRAPTGAPNPESINWVTGGDFNGADTEALLVTPTRAYRYARAAGQSWQQAFAAAPVAVDIPQYSQTEAISFSSGGKSFFISSENLPARLAEVPLR